MANMQQTITELNELIEAHRTRLHRLEVRAALEGINTPPECQIEINDIKEKIQEIQGQCAALSSGRELSREALSGLLKKREEIAIKKDEAFEIQAAFVNRDSEIKELLNPFSKRLAVIHAPAGYGKTYLLMAVSRRLVGLDRDKWLVVRHDCRIADTEIGVLRSLAKSIGFEIDERIDTMDYFILRVNRSLGYASASGICIQFDSLENWRKGDRWTGIARFVQGTFVPVIDEAMRHGGRRLKVLFAGRYVSDFARGFRDISPSVIELSPFGFSVLQELVRDTLQRFEELQSCRLEYTSDAIEYLVEELLDITGGHPRAVVSLVQNLGDYGFAIDLKHYFRNENKERLFKEFVTGQVEELFREVAPSIQQIFKVLSVFRGFNVDTISALLDSGYIQTEDQTDSWELYKQIMATHLIQAKAPLSHDRILQRVLDAQMRFTQAIQYQMLQQFAVGLYDGWLHGKDHQGADLKSSITGSDQVTLMVESLYHTCRFLTATGAKDPLEQLKQKIRGFLAMLRFFGAPASGRNELRICIEDDEQLPILLRRLVGKDGYRDLLELILS